MDAYDGEAVNPKYLSMLERMLGYGKYYNAAAAQDSDGSDGKPAAAISKVEEDALVQA